MTARGEAQVRRLACLYAVIDQSHKIRPEHLEAAHALWRYAEASVHFVFGRSLGDPFLDRIYDALVTAGEDGMSRNDINELFQGNVPTEKIAWALAVLQDHQLATCKKVQTTGRPQERWYVRQRSTG